MNCKICGAQSDIKLTIRVLNKYDVEYFQCTSCSFIQTEEPYWLNESYDSAITELDIGLVSRNQTFAELTAKLLVSGMFNDNGSFLDYGGGYGMFVRMMRDTGFDFYRQDIYCQNIFAKHFDVTDAAPGKKFELLTAFEVFEHLTDPLAELYKMLSYSDNIFFSTELQPSTINSEKDWWYFTPETGQHIALYSYQSLQKMAELKGLNLYSDKHWKHLFTKKKLPQDPFKIVKAGFYEKTMNSLNKRAGLKSKIKKRQSFLDRDIAMVKSLLNKQNT